MKDYKELANALREWSVAVDNRELDGTEDGLLATDLMIAANVIELLQMGIEEECKKHEWYTVEEKLPENEEWVIAVDKDWFYYPQARLSDGTWEWAYEAGADYWEDIDEPVTYWTHFPDPPKGAEE